MVYASSTQITVVVTREQKQTPTSEQQQIHRNRHIISTTHQHNTTQTDQLSNNAKADPPPTAPTTLQPNQSIHRCLPDGVARAQTDPLRDRSVLALFFGQNFLYFERFVRRLQLIATQPSFGITQQTTSTQQHSQHHDITPTNVAAWQQHNQQQPSIYIHTISFYVVLFGRVRFKEGESFLPRGVKSAENFNEQQDERGCVCV